MTPEVRARLLAATREAAAAFVEDMAHIRNVLDRSNPDRGELRRLSNELRRLLIDNGGDLRDIAAPRTGRVFLLSPDNKAVYVASRKRPYAFFGSAGVSIYGVGIRAAAVERSHLVAPLQDFDPERTIFLPLDGFLSQDVLCLDGRWIKRRDTIKYVANIASGVHSGAPKAQVEYDLSRLRLSARYSAIPGTPFIHFDLLAALHPDAPPFLYAPESIDPVLVEVLATARYLAQSPDVIKLEELVISELAQSG